MKKQLSAIVAVLLLFVAVGAIIAFKDKLKNIPNNGNGSDETRLSAEAYSIGSITEEGEIDTTSKKSIYTRDKIKCEDIADILVLGAVDYAIAYYNEDGEFIAKEDYAISIITMAMSEGDQSSGNVYSCRIIITPRDDIEITLSEIAKYANMLEVWIKRGLK